VASTPWLQHLAARAKELGSLLIIDEVQAGCGRTGTFFSFEDAGPTPDIICLAKSISGIGFPMGLVLIKPEHDQWAPGEHNGTFRGNNLAFVSASVAARLWRSPQFVSHVRATSAHVVAWLTDVAQESGEFVSMKGRGLMSGLIFHRRGTAQLVAAEAFRRGLLIETGGPHGEVLKLFPPLTIELKVLEDGLRRLREAILSVDAYRRGLTAA